MSYTELSIINKAGGKIGGFGDQLNGHATLANLTGTDKITVLCNAIFPQCRQKVIIDLASRGATFQCARKYADLGTEFRQYDEVIEDIVSSGGVVTVTTAEAHEFVTGDCLVLLGVRGTNDMELAINGIGFDITVVDITSFTLDGLTGTDSWEYTENSGVAGYIPEVGEWLYAFDLPSDCIAVVKQIDEGFISDFERRQEYRFDRILNTARDGWLLLTNNYSNIAGDSAFIEYAVDEEDTTLFDEMMVEAIATYLAAELCPTCGRDLKTRQELLAEYTGLSIPNCLKYNGSQSNNFIKKKVDFLGGRGNISTPLSTDFARRRSAI